MYKVDGLVTLETKCQVVMMVVPCHSGWVGVLGTLVKQPLRTTLAERIHVLFVKIFQEGLLINKFQGNSS